MSAGKRVLGGALLLLGGAGLVLGVALAAGVWYVRARLQERLGPVVARVEGAIDAAAGDLRTFRESVARARQNLEAVKAAPAPPDKNAAKKRLLAKTLTKTVHREVAPQATALHATLGRVTEGAVVLSTLLEDVDKFSFAASGSLDTEGLRNAGEALAEVSKQTEQLSDLFPEGAGPGANAAALNAQASKAGRALDRLDGLAAGYAARVDEAGARVETAKSRAHAWAGPVAVGLTLFFLWFSLAQLGLLRWGRSLLRGPAAG
jgi:hypothetical protein